jgi:hypothetical protein
MPSRPSGLPWDSTGFSPTEALNAPFPSAWPYAWLEVSLLKARFFSGPLAIADTTSAVIVKATPTRLITAL